MSNLIYTTIEGDTFDIIALDAYNDEFMAHKIIEANPKHASVVIFGAGEKLVIPIIEEQASNTLPPWHE